jgi:hypothetical protein
VKTTAAIANAIPEKNMLSARAGRAALLATVMAPPFSARKKTNPVSGPVQRADRRATFWLGRHGFD